MLGHPHVLSSAIVFTHPDIGLPHPCDSLLTTGLLPVKVGFLSTWLPSSGYMGTYNAVIHHARMRACTHPHTLTLLVYMLQTLLNTRFLLTYFSFIYISSFLKQPLS